MLLILLLVSETQSSVTECGVSVDGNQQRRGYSSLNGCFCVLSTDSDCDVLTCVSSLIRKPPTDNPYTQLKDQIIDPRADSENARLKELLPDLHLGDNTPSQQLMRMKEFKNGRVSEDVLKTLFLQRLLLSMQQIFSVCDERLGELAQTADKIGETAANASVIGEVKTTPSLSMLEARVEELTNQPQRLSRDLTRQQGRHRGSKSLSQARSVNDPNNTNCWYHTRFVTKLENALNHVSFRKTSRIVRCPLAMTKD
ncbi:hypothetical protein AVEN_197498-1 [Araneus ventricosus]|uniref:Uncharacterized protein n=1 Tax=Araneus ventricosus TaxID=182803 RepID=A0A4Y2BRI6_ARAVE|nr:hypothetical protein AVEN_197498-1 [Araneus ventricosus]